MENDISQDKLQEYLQNQISQIAAATASIEQKTPKLQAKKLSDEVEQLKRLFKQ